MPSPVSALTKIKNMYSPLERAVIAHKLESMPSSQWAAYIKANAPKGAKKEALAVRLDELLARQPKITKAEIVKHIQENSPKLTTKNIRADGFGSDETQYAKYVLPGGHDYTETLIHLPANTSSPRIRMQKVFEIADENGKLLSSGTVPMPPRTLEMLNNNPNWVLREYEQPHPADVRLDPSNFTSGHFDEPNIVAHLRTNIKTTPDNKDVLFLEELQSDWAQKGRKKGFTTYVEPLTKDETDFMNYVSDNFATVSDVEKARFKALAEKNGKAMKAEAARNFAPLSYVPSGPYVEDTNDWTALALKKAIERAVDEGQSHLAWTTGAQQADRYNLAKQIDSIHHSMNPDGTYSFSAVKNGQEVISKEGLTQDELADHLGKDIAEKIVKSEGVDSPAGTSVGWEAEPSIYGDVNAPPQPRTLSGLDLQVGGEGMKTYYDQIVPSTANDILKSMGVTERVRPIGIQLQPNQVASQYESMELTGRNPGDVIKPGTVSEQMGFEITPEIRDYVMNQGFPAFAVGGAVKAAAKGLREMAEHYMAPKATPAVNRIDMNYKDVTKRIPELTKAANMLETGEVTASEYDKLVNSLKPVTPYSFVPAPATYEDAMRALTKNKQPMFGRTSDIPAGEQTDLRLDIPAYKDHGVWVNSIHRKDAPTVYDSVSSVKNATMIGAPEKALKVAKGGPKAPFAVIRGEWNPISQEDAVKQAQENLASGEWVQVGYDPERHGYFYDRNTMEPVSGAEEIIQIGPLVIAKNPTYAAKGEQKFRVGGPVHMEQGGQYKDPFAELSVLDKAKLLAKAAKYRIQYNEQAAEHGKYPEVLSSALKRKYLDDLGNSRVNRSPLDAAINYGGGYDFGVRQDIPADVARDMGKAYQYTDYFFSPFTGPKSDAVGDYYENMAGVEAGIKERGRRATEAEIQRRSADYGKRSSKMLPQYEEENFADGGAVKTDDIDYDEMYEFKDYGNRETGEAKDTGALGEIRMPNGRDVMTEYSINVDGREMPSIVEGMHPADLNYIRETGTVPEDAVATAIRSANKREARGESPFWNKKETPAFADGGEVDYDAMYEFKQTVPGFAKGGPVLSVGRGEKLPVSKGAGLTAKGRAKYNAATGSNLKAPAPNPKTKADAGRRKSFCARMSGMPGPMKDEQGNPTRKAASLKRWNCN